MKLATSSLLRGLLPAVLLGLLLGCSDATAPEAFPFGRYEMVEIDGQPLPQEVAGIEFVSGTLTLNPDHTYHRLTTGWQEIEGVRVALHDDRQGTFTGSPEQLRLRDQDGSIWEANITADRLTIDGGWLVIVYRRGEF